MTFSREEVERIARLARLALSEAEKEQFARQLGEVLRYMERLGEAATEGVEPTSHAVDLRNVMRDDVPEDPLAGEDVMRNAPASSDGMFLVPRVIEGGIES